MSQFTYDTSCEEEAPQHVCSSCDDGEENRIGSAAAIHEDYIDTLRASQELQATWDAGILSGDIILFPAVNGSIAEEPNFVPGYGRVEEEYQRTKFTVKFIDPNWADNHASYNLLRRNRRYHIAYAHGSQTQISLNPASWRPKETSETSTLTNRTWDVEVVFTQRDNPIPFPTPDVFVCGEVTA